MDGWRLDSEILKFKGGREVCGEGVEASRTASERKKTSGWDERDEKVPELIGERESIWNHFQRMVANFLEQDVQKMIKNI